MVAIMLKYKNIQGVAVALVVVVTVFWFLWARAPDDQHKLITSKEGPHSAKLVPDTSVKDKELLVTLEKVIQAMKSETQKMKVSFQEEKRALIEKNAQHSSQVNQMKEQLNEKQNNVDEKGKVLHSLEARIRDISQSNDKLSKENNRLTQTVITKPFLGKKLVHFDLKGAPPKLDYLIEVMYYAKRNGADGFLIEYEDMFPWEQEFAFLRSKNAYTKDDIKKILKTAADEKMSVVPLIQTFGHLEFLLKHKDFKHLRADKEITNVICPINKGSVPVVKKMMKQILDMHPDAELIHLGGDEVYNLKTCEKCRASNMSDFELYTHHMIPLFEYIGAARTSSGKSIKPIIWDDMLRKWQLSKLKVIAQYVTPMVWGYVPDLSAYHNFPDGMWDRFAAAFPTIWIASSFKGALKPWTNFVPLKHHLDNHLSWLNIIASLEKKGSNVVGVAITGWSRYDHYGPLCELLPAAIPSLTLCLAVLAKGKFDNELHKAVSEKLQFEKPFQIDVTNFKGYVPETAGYPGGKIYHLIGSLEKAIGWYDWSNVRITGWTRPYNKKRQFISFFQLNTTLFGLNQSKDRLKGLKTEAFNTLIPMFDKDTVEEWIEDKIEYHINLATASIDYIKQMVNHFNFT